MICMKEIPARQAVKKVREQAFKNKQNGVKFGSYGVNFDWFLYKK